MIEEVKKEIQRQLQEAEERLSHIKARGWVAPNEEQLIAHLKGLLSFINTLEMKEVDLDKEINAHWDEWAKENGFHFIDIAKHFFELGIQAQQQ